MAAVETFEIKDTSSTASIGFFLPVSAASAGERLVAVFVADGSANLSVQTAGWTLLFTTASTIGDDITMAAAWKESDGTETAVSVAGPAGVEQWAGVLYRITDHVTADAPEYVLNIGSGNAPDPSNLAFSWGADTGDTLVCQVVGQQGGGTTSVSTYPSGYVNTSVLQSNSQDNGAMCAGCTIQTSAASEDAGAWALTASDTFIALSIGVRGQAGAPGPTDQSILFRRRYQFQHV